MRSRWWLLPTIQKAFDAARSNSVLNRIMSFSKESFIDAKLSLLSKAICVDRYRDIKSRGCSVRSKTMVTHSYLPYIYTSHTLRWYRLKCFQYANDTTIYLHTKVCNLDDCTTDLNRALSRLKNYSIASNLALNTSKTKWILFSTTKRCPNT